MNHLSDPVTIIGLTCFAILVVGLVAFFGGLGIGDIVRARKQAKKTTEEVPQ